MIEFKPDVHYVCFGFLEWGGQAIAPDGNLMLLVEQGEEKEWKMTYRFRYFKDGKVFDSADTKNWYTCKIPKKLTEPEVVHSIATFMAKVTEAIKPDVANLLVIDGDNEKALAMISQRPWAHVKELEGGEYVEDDAK